MQNKVNHINKSFGLIDIHKNLFEKSKKYYLRHFIFRDITIIFLGLWIIFESINFEKNQENFNVGLLFEKTKKYFYLRLFIFSGHPLKFPR